ncbi:MAG TPA: hypothetical protein VK956_00655 [Verrucomicrobium sp.]|nr:hypothetical protein [Verrucomicrobium sp.]
MQPAPVGVGPLGRALGLFALLLGVVILATGATVGSPGGGKKAARPAPLPKPVDVVDLRLEADGYATLKGITFVAEELPDQIGGLRTVDGLPAVRVRAPRDLALPVLMKVMQDLKEAGVPQTALEFIPEP